MKLGVIGGLGPMATAYFMELVTKMTRADKDQEHLEMIIYSAPWIPDRTAYILGRSEESPLPGIVKCGRELKKQQVDCVAIPCITAHYFHDEIEKEIALPVVHAIRETALTLKREGIRKVGIMATDGTIESGIFQREIQKQGMEAVLPDKETQKLVMSLIYENVKAGIEPDMNNFDKVREYMKEAGAQVVVLGCTELSVIKKDYPNACETGFIDAMEVLAKTSVLQCGKSINPQYEKLFLPFGR